MEIEQKSQIIYITGDTHGRFRRMDEFCTLHETKKEDIMIILGDAAINYLGWPRDNELKKMLSKLNITLFCVHGNHEIRPETIPTYTEMKWHGGVVYMEPEYPNILFAKDGEIYDFNGHKTLVIGGAYSVDRDYRILRNPHNPYWWPDEQPSDEIKKRVEEKLDSCNWKVDVVLSHTVPRNYEPVEVFLAGIDQSSVDKSTENWLQTIEDRLEYRKWYAGHYHTCKIDGKVEIMYENVKEFKIQSEN